MTRLQLWLTRYEKQIAVVVMVICLVSVFTLKLSRKLMPIVVAIFASSVHTLAKRRSLTVIAGLLMLFVAIYATGGHILLTEEVHLTPLSPLADVDASVLLGGDHIRVHTDERCFNVTVCFYVADTDLCVIAAHSCETQAGETVKVLLVPFSKSGSEPPDWCPVFDPNATDAEVLLDSDYGVILSGIQPPRSGPDELPIGKPDDIGPGEEALLHTARSGVLPAEIKGFWLSRNGHLIVAQLTGKEPKILSGFSGSPVVQNGKLIGFLAATHAVPFRGPQIILVRPACDVYNELLLSSGHANLEP
ncbi:MAG: hypothetical protein GX784_02315 [Firmicutes bacterium]|jgi:hypothetical protein|nr:hypothetical protein [Candidatus Fermentithermobacillaceae bacterium]